MAKRKRQTEGKTNSKSKTQSTLNFVKIPAEKIEKLGNVLEDVFETLKDRFTSTGKFGNVLVHGENYTSKDVKDRQQPEELVKRVLVEPLLEYFGYIITSEINIPTGSGFRRPDYAIRSPSKTSLR